MKSNRARIRSPAASKGPRTPRNRGGAPAGNLNGQKDLEWLSSYDLSSPAGIDAFMQEVIRRVWTGQLGSRSGGCINGTLRLLLEHQLLPSLERRISELEKQVRR